MKYIVTFETRSRNAIGCFNPHTVEVEAPNKEEACCLAMKACHARNLETRFPISCKEVIDEQ